MILKKQLQTSGRESESEIKSSNDTATVSEFITGLIKALGGIENLKNVDCCFTRLRIITNDPSKVAEDAIFTDDFAAKGVVHVGDAIQIVYGPNAELYKTEILKMLEKDS